jgi:hypothetical protein
MIAKAFAPFSGVKPSVIMGNALLGGAAAPRRAGVCAGGLRAYGGVVGGAAMA